MLTIYIDADACPVKQEVYRVAKRYDLQVIVVSNAWMRVPLETWIKLVIVEGRPDSADDWIVEHAEERDIVISSDIPLASRSLAKGAVVISPTGRRFTEESIGEALATRELMSHLRELGSITGGPAPFDKRDRSRFLQSLDQAIQAIRRASSDKI